MTKSNLSILNRERKQLPGPRFLHDAISTNNDNDLAIDFLRADGSRVKLTYRDFRRRTSHLGHRLRKCIAKTVKHGSIVPVIIPQSPELYIAWVAVLDSGAAFCPILPDTPAERLKFIVNDVQADVVLTLPEFSPAIESILRGIQCVSVSDGDHVADPDTNGYTNGYTNGRDGQDVHNTPQDIAYVMYTSGSTGVPKGVRVPHLSVTQSLLAHEEHIPHFKRFLQFASPTFDVSVFEVFFPLLRGATLVGCDRERMLGDLPATIVGLDVDAAELTPTVVGSLLRTRASAPCLKTLLTIGEMLTKRVIDEFGGSKGQRSMLYGMYGPTEAAIHCTIAPTMSMEESTSIIGRPLSTVTAFVLSEASQNACPRILPCGEPGELAVAGQLASGYLNRPDQNKAAFVELPGYGLVYRTGDRARCHPDGRLSILGRISSGQVKVRGQRVELGEIEQVIGDIHEVHLALASVINDNIVVFCDAEQHIRVSDIQKACKSWLPRFMIPSEVVLLHGHIPRLPSGKVDRKTLELEYSRDMANGHDEHNGHRATDFNSSIQREVSEAIEAELGQRLSKTASIWNSGLDSLKAIKIAARLRPSFNGLSVTSLLEADSIEELCASLQREEEMSTNSPQVDSLGDSDRWRQACSSAAHRLAQIDSGLTWTQIMPCSSIQNAMLSETIRVKHLNFNKIKITTQTPIRREALWSALKQVAEKNEILRSGFVDLGETDVPFVQVIFKTLEEYPLDLLHPLVLNDTQKEVDTEFDFSIHHALYDGWSWDLILDDLTSVLNGNDLIDRPQYAQVRAIQDSKSSAHKQQHLERWHQYLQNFEPVTFPSLRASRCTNPPRESVVSHSTVSFRDITKFATRHRVSRQNLFQAAWALLLTAYTDSDDCVFGFVQSGRHLPLDRMEAVVGPCLATFPMRINFAELRSGNDLLNFIQTYLHHCLQADAVALSDLQQMAGMSPGEKLFDTLFVWQQGSSKPNTTEQFFRTTKTQDSLDYAIVVEVEPFDDTIVMKITFDESILPSSHAEILLNQLNSLASSIIADPTRPLLNRWSQFEDKALSISPCIEPNLDQSCDFWSNMKKAAFDDRGHAAIEFVKDFSPESGTIEKETITYKALWEKSGVVAQNLVEKVRIIPDDLVCVIAEKSTDLYIVILAVLMAGAGYMCIDPRTPSERIVKILEQASCKAVLVDSSARLADIDTGESLVVDFQELTTHPVKSNISLPIHTKPGHLAYAIFTSGSTGVPKGVMLTRQNLNSNIEYLRRSYPHRRGADKLLQACSPAFDVSVFEIFWTWYAGLTLCAATNDIMFRDFQKFVQCMHVTHLSLTPSVAALLNSKSLPDIKMLVTAGEPMNSKVYSEWAGHGLYQGYGPSETTNICSIRPQVEEVDVMNNVGRGFSNTSLFICQRQKSDRHSTNNGASQLALTDFAILPKGAVGEIWIGGDQVGRGYMDLKLTAKSFLDHPQHGRLYRSGDIGRLLSDNSLVIIGREDDQVKLRGQRIELGDINTTILRFPTAKDVYTSVIPDSKGNAKLLSFWTSQLRNGERFSSGTMRRLYDILDHELPTYMVPDLLILVDDLPLTRQGKIDKNALTEHYRGLTTERLRLFSRPIDQQQDVPPFTEQEKEIVQSLSGILGEVPDTFTRSTSLMALGVDSLNAIKLARRIRKDQSRPIDVSQILKCPTLGHLLSMLNQTGTTQTQRPTTRILRDVFDQGWTDQIVKEYSAANLEVEKVLPCTPLQEFMLSQSSEDADAYRNKLRFSINTDIESVRHAWSTIVQRHEILRTAFVTTESRTYPFAQVILKRFKLLWHEQPEVQQHSHRASELARPPYQFTVEQTKPNSFELILDMHHCVYDAEAMSVLLQEVEACCKGQQLGSIAPFSSYIRFMMDMDREVSGQFWEQYLEKVKPSRLTHSLAHQTFITGPQVDSITHCDRIASIKLQDVSVFARSHSITLLSTLQTAWARLLSRYTSCSDVCFGNVFSGRNLPLDDADRIVGPCFNTLPIRLSIRSTHASLDLIRQLQKDNFDITSFQPSSIRQIQQRYSPDGRQLFDTLILLQQETTSLDQTIWTLLDDEGSMTFPFIIEVLPRNSQNDICLTLHSTNTDAAVLGQILDNLDAVLTHTIRYPLAKANDYSSIENGLPSLRMPDSIPSSNDNEQVPEAKFADNEGHASPHEEQIHSILTELLESSDVKFERQTSLFRYGLDSIVAVKAAAMLRSRGYHVSSVDILDNPTVSAIAEKITAKQPKHNIREPMSNLSTYASRYRADVYAETFANEHTIEIIRPCTPVQAGIIIQFLHSKGRLYFNYQSLTLRHDIDEDRLRSAWEETIKLHEMLRTGFVHIRDKKYPFAMVTYRPTACDLPWLRNEQQRSSYVTAESEATELGSECFSQMQEPPWRLRVRRDGRNRYLEIFMHHALYDAQSMEIILADVCKFYNKERVEEPSDITQVLSIILDQNNIGLAKQFWLGCGESLESTTFPDLRIYRSEQVTPVVANRKSGLSRNDLQKIAKGLETRPQILLQIIWARLLAAYNGKSTVTFGITLSGRAFEDEVDNKVAFPCITTLPIAINTEDSMKEIISNLSQVNSGLLRHQFTPLTEIKRWLGLDNDLFDTILVLQDFIQSQNDAKLWTSTQDYASAEYAVSMEILPDSQGNIHLQLTTRTNIVPQEAADQILDQFDTLLRDLRSVGSESSQKPATSLQSVIRATHDRLRSPVHLMHQLVERSCDASPDKIALEFVTAIENGHVSKHIFTYKDLNSYSNKIAHQLLQKGMRVGDRAAVCFEKCVEAVFAIIAVLKAGGTYVAIDPGAPESRKRFILDDSECKIVLTTHHLSDQFNETDIEIVLADDQAVLDQFPATQPELASRIDPNMACYCLYTSGTTGTPKGCLISHDNAVQAMLAFQHLFSGRWEDNSRFLQFASFHFDVSVLELFWTFSVGICLTSAPRDLMLEDLVGTLHTLQITHLDLTPSLARLISPETVPSLTKGVFIVGGEQVGQDILEIWGGAGCLYNFYGPSEVTIGCTVHQNVPRNAKATNIGQPWPNVGAFVLKPDTQEVVPRGTVGELCLSGPLVCNGYLNRPDLTAEKFIVLKEFDTRIYRSGDLVRMLHDDSFEFLGRIDDQVKLRGQRLEIGEINHTILAADKRISGAATMILKHPELEKEQLVAFWSTKSTRTNNEPGITTEMEASKTSAQAKAHCQSKLPGYMLPTYFIALSFIPLSVNNKVDHKRLRAIFEKTTLRDIVSPSIDDTDNDVQDPKMLPQIVQILAEYLQIEPSQVKSSSTLFELGLDSISAIGLSRVFKDNGYETATIQNIMQNSQVASLASILTRNKPLSAPKEDRMLQQTRERINNFASKHRQRVFDVLGVSSNAIEAIVLCTSLQEGMVSKVLHDDSDTPAYMNSFEFILNRHVDQKLLDNAWNRVESSESSLRTYFVPTEEGVAQVVLRPCNERKYKSYARSDTNTSNASELFQSWINTASKFGREKPWQVHLSSMKNKLVMHLFIFHGIYDGISLDLLLKRVAIEYVGGVRAEQDAPHFYQVISSGLLHVEYEAATFWRSRLRYVNLFQVAQESKQAKLSEKSISLHKMLHVHELQPLSRKLHVTTSSIFHAICTFVLCQMFDTNLTLGLVVSGRNINYVGAENVIGPMFNTIPCTIANFNRSATMQNLIKACHQFNIDSLPYQHTSLRDIAKWTGHSLKQGLFSCIFVFQAEQPSEDNARLWKESDSATVLDYPLNLEVEQKVDGTFGLRLLAREFVGRQSCLQMFEMFERVLHQVVAGEHLKLPAAFCQGPQTTDELEIGHSPLKALDSTRAPTVSDLRLSETAKKVRHEISQLAHVEESSVGMDQPTIFELGLDSVDAMKLGMRLQKYGMSIPVSRIMRSPSLQGITASIEKAAQSEASHDKPSTSMIEERQESYMKLIARSDVDGSDIERIWPLTPMQEGLVLELGKYFVIAAFVLNADTDVDRLREAWLQAIKFIPILRAEFVAVDESNEHTGFLQVIRSKRSENTTIPQSLEPLQPLKRCMSQMKQAASDSDFWSQGLHLAFAKDENERTVLVTGMPHAMFDAWSIRLLHQCVADLYHDMRPGKLSRHRLDKYESHLNSVFQQSKSKEVRDFWQTNLRSSSSTIVRSQSTCQIKASGCLIQQESKLPLSDIFTFTKAKGITLQSLGLSCWTLMLSYLTKQLDICSGVVLSGRTTAQSDELIFPTFNTVVLRITIDKSETKEQFIQKVHGAVIDISEYQHFPLKEALKIGRSQTNNAVLFDTLFTLQKSPQSSSSASPPYQEMELEDDDRTSPYAINLEIEVRDGQMWWTVACQEGVLGEPGAKQLLHDLDQVLSSLISNPAESVINQKGHQSSLCGLPETRYVDTARFEPFNTQEDDSEFTEMERQIAHVLASMSKSSLSDIKRDTGFFHLGLDSISAVKISNLLKKQGVRLPVSSIVSEQTVRKMANVAKVLDNGSQLHVKEKLAFSGSDIKSDPAWTDRYGVKLEDVEEIHPATGGQIYMLDMYTASDERLFYAPFVFDVRETDEQLLAKAWIQLVKELPILRTVFVPFSTGRPETTLQVVLKPGFSGGRLQPPFVFRTMTLNKTLIMTLQIHHALYDAVSLQLMTSRLKELCTGCTTSSLELNIDLSSLLSHIEKPSLLEQQERFWRNYLADKKSSATVIRSSLFASARTEHFNPTSVPLSDLDPILKHHGISVQALFFAAYAKAYVDVWNSGWVSNSKNATREIVLGVYLANRSLDVERVSTLAAPTFNIVPLKVTVHSPPIESESRSSQDADKSHNAVANLVESARCIQDDIAQISRIENCGVSMRQIYDWTGVTIDTYVNFLRLPDDDDEESHDTADQQNNPNINSKSRSGTSEFQSNDARSSTPPSIHHADKPTTQQAIALLRTSDTKQPLPKPYLSELHTSISSSTNEYSQKSNLRWCQPSIDIEAKLAVVKGQKYLGIGLFAPEDVVRNTQEAKDIIEKITRIMLDVADAGIDDTK